MEGFKTLGCKLKRTFSFVLHTWRRNDGRICRSCFRKLWLLCILKMLMITHLERKTIYDIWRIKIFKQPVLQNVTINFKEHLLCSLSWKQNLKTCVMQRTICLSNIGMYLWPIHSICIILKWFRKKYQFMFEF